MHGGRSGVVGPALLPRHYKQQVEGGGYTPSIPSRAGWYTRCVPSTLHMLFIVSGKQSWAHDAGPATMHRGTGLGSGTASRASDRERAPGMEEGTRHKGYMRLIDGHSRTCRGFWAEEAAGMLVVFRVTGRASGGRRITNERPETSRVCLQPCFSSRPPGEILSVGQLLAVFWGRRELDYRLGISEYPSLSSEPRPSAEPQCFTFPIQIGRYPTAGADRSRDRSRYIPTISVSVAISHFNSE